MSKIEVRHTSIIINDYELGDSEVLENSFSIYDRITHCKYFKGVEYLEEEKKLILPRGIDIPFLENIFGTGAKVIYNHDKFDKVKPIKIKYLPRDDKQRKTIKFMLGELEYNYTRSKSQLCINLPTGVGKTYCSIATSCFLSYRSIIITDAIDILTQWKDCICEYTDTNPREIYIISGTPSIHMLFKKDNISQYKFILASHSTLKSYGDSYGWDKITELFEYLKVGLKFYDEAHKYYDNMCKLDFYTNTYKTYYITATPARSNEDENRIYKLSFKNIPSIDLFDYNSDPHTKYTAIKFGSKPNPQEVSQCKNAYGLDRNKYVSYIVEKENYYKLLHILLSMAMKVNGKVLIYIGVNKSITKTKKWIEENYPELVGEIGVYTSIVNKDIKEEQLERKIILSTTKSCGTAIDIKDLKMTIVLAEPFKSDVTAIQTLGRTRDNDTFYIDIVDNDFYYIKKYYNHKKPIFKKYALSCSEVNLNENSLDEKCNKIIEMRSKIYYPFVKIQQNPYNCFEREEKYNPFIRNVNL